MKRLDLVKEQLGEETTIRNTKLKRISQRGLEIIPITHNEGWIELLFCGWSIILKEDGTWTHIADTSGG